MPGTLILVTGPSGAGKDTLLDGARASLAEDGRILFARRVITRSATAGGELHTAVSVAEFLTRKAAGEFWADWEAHGLHYALPMDIAARLAQGTSVLANVSRTMTGELANMWPHTVVIEIAAPQELVNRRLNQRARESGAEIQQRLARVVPQSSTSVRTIKVINDSTVEDGITRFHRAISSVLDPSGNDHDANASSGNTE